MMDRCEKSESDVGTSMKNEATDTTALILDRSEEKEQPMMKERFYNHSTFRNQRRGGVLVIPSQRESVSSVEYERLHGARRAERFQKHGQTPDDLEVRFTQLTVREFPIILGDSPAGDKGPPIQIDWEPCGEDVTINLDEYEEKRPPRRDKFQMSIPSDRRVEMLRDIGYSRTEITAGTRPVNLARATRARAVEAQKLQPVSELAEKVSRKAIHIMTFGARKRRERKFLEPYCASIEMEKGERDKSPSHSTENEASSLSELEFEVQDTVCS